MSPAEVDHRSTGGRAVQCDAQVIYRRDGQIYAAAVDPAASFLDNQTVTDFCLKQTWCCKDVVARRQCRKVNPGLIWHQPTRQIRRI